MKLLWTVLLLALVPLTMAPRTATEPAPVDGFQVELTYPPGSVKPGSAVPLHVKLTNLEPSRDGVLVISATMAGEVRWVSVTRGCRVSGGSAQCPFDLDEGGSARFKATVLPMSPGDLNLDVSTAAGSELALDSIRVTRGKE